MPVSPMMGNGNSCSDGPLPDTTSCYLVLRVDWGAERLIAQRMVYHERKGICENNRGVEYGTV